MWFDELFTFYISRMSLGNIWTILSSGIEPNPPLSYWLTHFSMGLFGQNEIAVRLPAIAGYWLMSICLFFFVRRYGSDVCAAVAMLFPLCTEAYLPYAAEGRGYGLVLGFSGLACLCWQYACSHRSRNLAVIGLWLSLVGALVSHYYSVLMLIPFGVAEVVRWWRSRRLDLPVAAAIVGSLLPLAILYPALKRGSAFITQLVRASSNFWAMPSAS